MSSEPATNELTKSRREQEVQGFMVCSIDDIIASKEAARREKDKESLPRLMSFRDYWKQRRGG